MVFDGIHYRAGKKDILVDACVSIGPGEVCGLFGPNGSGKTSLIRVGTGLLKPTRGQVSIGGVPLPKNVNARYARLSHLDQYTFLPLGMRVDRLIASVGNGRYARTHFPDELIGRYIDTLSGGERRLLEVVLILSLQRDYVLLDEPFTGVDPLIIERMMELISAERSAGRGILITDQYHFHVTEIADSAYLMTDGKCEALDGANDLEGQLKRRGYLPESSKR